LYLIWCSIDSRRTFFISGCSLE